MKKLIYILTINFLAVSCNTKDDYIQEVYVNEYLNLSLPEFSGIAIPGTAIFVEGGVEGIIIYHGVGNDYKIYDRNCSYEPSLPCSVIDSVNSGIAFCGCCTSAFLLSSSGESINAPALLSLKTYNWALNDNNVLHIFN